MSDQSAAGTELSVTERISTEMEAVHGRVGLHVRGQHPKGHAVLQATVQVLDVPAGLRVGVFANCGREIRFAAGCIKCGGRAAFRRCPHVS